jgi:hypothetical protein
VIKHGFDALFVSCFNDKIIMIICMLFVGCVIIARDSYLVSNYGHQVVFKIVGKLF